MFNKKDISKTFALCLGVLIMSFLVGYLVLAWTEPTAAPPGENVYAPINVGPDGQTKEGGILVANNSGVTYGLIVRYGSVGIGTTSPGAKLEVYGGGDILLKDDANDPGDLIFQNSAGTEYGRMYALSDGLRLRASSTRNEDFFIRNSDGNVGIGTTSPGAKLTIKGGGLEVLRIEEGGDLTFCTGAGSCNVGLFSDNPDELTVGYGGNLKVNGNLNVGGKISGSIFGAWESKSLNTVYQAPSDGFVVAKITTPFGGKGWISGLTDSSNPPATERAVATVDSTTAANSSSFTMPVRKNDYWKVIYGDVSGTPVKLLYWIPLGN